METALRCTVSQNPSSWSQQLLWVEYAHNTLTSSATGLSPFQCAYGYRLPLFPALEKEASCPSVQAFPLKAASRYFSAANRPRTQAPEYQMDQKVWLSTCDLHCGWSPTSWLPSTAWSGAFLVDGCMLSALPLLLSQRRIPCRRREICR